MSSLFRMINRLEELAKAQRVAAGQFIDLPDWALKLENSGLRRYRDENGYHAIDPKEFAKAKRLIAGKGKLKPQDVETLIQNRNLDLLHELAMRSDLAPEQAQKILADERPFAETRSYVGPGQDALVDRYVSEGYGSDRGGPREAAKREGFISGYGKSLAQKKKEDLYRLLTGHVSAQANGYGEALKNGSEDYVHDRLRNAIGTVSPDQLLGIITERPHMGKNLAEAVTNHPNFDAGHLIEMINRREPHVKLVAAQLAGRKPHLVNPQIEHLLEAEATPEMRAEKLKNNLSVTADQLSTALRDESPVVRQSVMSRLANLPGHPGGEQNNQLLDQIIQRSRPDEFGRFLTGLNDKEWRTQKGVRLTPEQHEAVVHRIETDPTSHPGGADHRGGYESALFGGNQFTPDQLVRLYRVSALSEDKGAHRDAEQYVSDDRFPASALERIASGQEPHNPAYNPETKLAQAIVAHKNATPAALASVWNTISANPNPNDYAGNTIKSGLLGNKNTPPEVLSQMMGAHLSEMPLNVQLSAMKRTDIDRQAIERLWAGQGMEEDSVRKLKSAFAQNPAHTPEDVTRALQDPDPMVRREWIKNAPTLSPEHWEMIKRDRSPNNRMNSLGRSDVPEDVLLHFLTNDKARAVNEAALSQSRVTDGAGNVTRDLRDKAVAAMKPDNLLEAMPDQFTTEQLNQIHKRLVEAHVVKLAKLAKQKFEKPEDKEAAFKKADTEYKARLMNLTKFHGLAPEHVSQALREVPVGSIDRVIQLSRRAGTFTPEHSDVLLDRPDAIDHHASIVRTQNLSPARWEKILGNLVPGSEAAKGIIDSATHNHNLPPSFIPLILKHADSEVLKTLIDRGRGAENTPESARQLFEAIKKSPEDDYYGREALLSRYAQNMSQIPEDVQDQMWPMLNERGAQALVSRHDASEKIVNRALAHPNEYVKRAATEKLAFQDPDRVNGQLESGGEVMVHPAVEKLKNLKGIVEEAGGSINKNKVENKGQGLPPQLFDGKGNITSQSIDNYIESLPKERFNTSWGKWAGCQRHDPSVPQKVLQVNLTNAHVKALKEAGLWEDFLRAHEHSYHTAHPVLKHTLGWARIDDSHPGHAHIDEIQSDFGQGTIRSIEEEAEDGRISEETAKKRVGALKSILKTFAGPFKSINHAIFAATHQALRDRGDVVHTSMDTIEDQARQSGAHTSTHVSPNDVESYVEAPQPHKWQHRALELFGKQNGLVDKQGKVLSPTAFREAFKEKHGEGAELPVPLQGFMNQTYKDLPESVGYQDKPKKEVMPNTQAPENTVQMRKLVKSLTKLALLCKMLDEV